MLTRGSALASTWARAIPLTPTPTQTHMGIRMATMIPTIILTPTVIRATDFMADTAVATEGIAVDTVAGIAVDTAEREAIAAAEREAIAAVALAVAAATVVDTGKQSAKVVD